MRSYQKLKAPRPNMGEVLYFVIYFVHKGCGLRTTLKFMGITSTLLRLSEYQDRELGNI
jgi:hypothetical protein